MAEPAEHSERPVQPHEPAGEPGQRPVDRLLAAMAGKGDLPAAARVIQRLHEAVRREDCNGLDVARIILGDPGLSSKVLRVVNSSYYRPRGEPVSTITRAVILLGFETIRDLATGLVLLDEMTRASGGRAAIRGVLRQSLLAGSVARALATTIHHPNPEEAYLLGLFANWGELSLAAYFPEEYAQAAERARAAGAPLADALVEAFGVTPAALATAMLARWDFPASYADYFRVPHPESDRPVVGSGQRLFALVDLAHDYAAYADAHGVHAPIDPEAVRRYEAMFGRRGDELRTAIARGIEEAETTPIRAATPYLSPPRAADPRSRADAPSPVTHPAPSVEHAPGRDGATGAAAPAAFGILAEITRHILAQENINDTLAMVLEGIARTGPYDVAFLALLSAKKDRLIGRLGYGEGVADFLSALDIPIGRHDAGVLAECLQAREPRVVPQATAAMFGSSAATTAGIPAASFIAHPLVVRGRPVGVLVVARGAGRKPVAADDLTVVQLFCSQAALALDRAVH